MAIRVRAHASVVTVLGIIVQLFVPANAYAVSTWNPTLLVNTESFQEIDGGDGTTSVDLRFGGSTSTLKLLSTGSFQFSKSLSVIGSISGSSLTIDGVANFSGAVLAKSSITAKGSLSGSSFYGSGLGDCNNSTTSKLIYNPSTGKFSCATDQTGGGTSGGGLGYADAQGIFVKKSGDTMTGALAIEISLPQTTTGALNIHQMTHATGALIDSDTTQEPALAIDIVGTPNAPHLLFGYQGAFDTNLYRAAANLLKTNDSFFAVGTISGSALRIDGSADIHGALSASGAVHFDSNLSINDDRTAGADAILTFGNGTLNQDLKYLDATQKFQFSTNLNVMGSISGASLVISGASSFSGSALFRSSLTTKGALSGATFYGAGLGDCSNALTSKLLYNPATGHFSCAEDQTGGGTSGGGLGYADAQGIFVKKSGDTMTGALVIQNGNSHTPTLTPILNVRGTISGSLLKASNMTVSGAVVYSSGNTLQQNAKGLSGQLLISQGTSAPKWAAPVGGMIWYFDGPQTAAVRRGPVITMPFGITLNDTTMTAQGAPTGAAFIVDINMNGTSIFATRPQINAGATTGNAAVFSTINIPPNAVLTLDIDQVGSTYAGSGITIMLKGTRNY